VTHISLAIITLGMSCLALGACEGDKSAPADTATTEVADSSDAIAGDVSGDVSGDADSSSPDAVDSLDASELPDTAGACPSEPPTSGGACSTAGQSCGFGKECCCGQCYPSLTCRCTGGTWACLSTDACLLPACPDATGGDADAATPDADAATPDADAAGPDTNGACEAATATLAAQLYAKIQAYSVVVRLDHDTLAPLGYAVVAGPYKSLDESAARAEATAQTGYGAGALLSGPNPEDAWVFYESPGDFGGVGVVSARTGLSVLGGSIVWDGAGDLTWPKTWSPASDLASGCPISGGLGTHRGFDLVTGDALASKDLDSALAVVATTAIPAAMWQGGYAFDAVVLRYPRTVGGFDPSTAEWIVILSGGWLE
jgi:hypothetical protein